jgi:hypothetical protein
LGLLEGRAHRERYFLVGASADLFHVQLVLVLELPPEVFELELVLTATGISLELQLSMLHLQALLLTDTHLVEDLLLLSLAS